MRKYLLWLLALPLLTATPHAGRAAEGPAPDAERYYALTIGGKRVGYEHYLRTRAPSGGVKVVSDSLVKLGVLGTPLDVTTQAIGEYGPDGVTPQRYALTLKRGSNATTVQCRFQKQTVEWSQTSGGQTTRRPLTLAPGTLVAESMDTWAAVLRKAPSTDQSFSVIVFDPILGISETLQFVPRPAEAVTVAGKPVRCRIWQTSVASPVGPQTLLFGVRSETGELITLRVPAQDAVFQLSDEAALKDVQDFDLTSRAFAITDIPLANAQALTRVKVHAVAKVMLQKITPQSLQRAPTQTFQGTVKDGIADGIFTVRALHYTGAHAAAFPYTPAAVTGQQKWLRPDALSESDDPQIRALAKRLTAGSKTGWEASSRIGRWVFQHIKYKITGASAKVCLTTKEGDCGPHTNLTIALCRAAGIPARITGGALYTDLLGGSYGQHYWTRVWMGPKDGWVPIDTTTGEIGTLSPTHLTLWDLGALGSLSVKVLDFAPKTASPTPAPPQARHPNGLATGYKEKYVFRVAGKEIGTQTAELTQVSGDVQSWTYALNLAVPQSGQTVAVQMNATATVTDTGRPVRLALDVTAAGMKQGLTLDCSSKPARAVITMGDTKVPRTVTIADDQFLLLNNMPTLISLAMRSLPLSGSKPIRISFFAAETLQPFTLTLTPQGTETLTVGGTATPCQVFAVAPLGERFWAEKASGALVKITDEKQKLVMTRE